MPQPTSGTLHLDVPLTNISVAYMQSQDHFVAARAAPIVPVDKQSNKYFTFTKADWFRDEARRRGSSEESAGSGYSLSSATYYCDVFAIHKDVGDQDQLNTDSPLDWRRNATQFVTQRQLLRREKQWADDLFTTSVWGTDSTPGNLWSDYTNSDPLSDIETGKRTVLVNTGFEPNTLILGYDVWQKMKQHPDIVDRYKYTSAESITKDMLGRLVDVENVLVCKALINSSVENETASYGFVQGKHALLCYCAPSPGLEVPSAMYTFSWRGVSDGNGTDIAVRDIRIDTKRCNRIEAEIAVDFKAVATDLGYFFASVVA